MSGATEEKPLRSGTGVWTLDVGDSWKPFSNYLETKTPPDYRTLFPTRLAAFEHHLRNLRREAELIHSAMEHTIQLVQASRGGDPNDPFGRSGRSAVIRETDPNTPRD